MVGCVGHPVCGAESDLARMHQVRRTVHGAQETNGLLHQASVRTMHGTLSKVQRVTVQACIKLGAQAIDDWLCRASVSTTCGAPSEMQRVIASTINGSQLLQRASVRNMHGTLSKVQRVVEKHTQLLAIEVVCTARDSFATMCMQA
eukprot:1161534-Pelagomonas_calceolata.AAC.1